MHDDPQDNRPTQRPLMKECKCLPIKQALNELQLKMGSFDPLAPIRLEEPEHYTDHEELRVTCEKCQGTGYILTDEGRRFYSVLFLEHSRSMKQAREEVTAAQGSK